MFATGMKRDSKRMPDADSPVTVFLADDSALIRTRVAAMLAAPWMRIVGQGATPAACISGILASRPDAVVLDVQLAGGTGLEVLSAVKGSLPGTAFIVLSNNSQTAYRKRYLAAGARVFLDKSTEFDLLAQAIAAARTVTPK